MQYDISVFFLCKVLYNLIILFIFLSCSTTFFLRQGNTTEQRSFTKSTILKENFFLESFLLKTHELSHKFLMSNSGSIILFVKLGLIFFFFQFTCILNFSSLPFGSMIIMGFLQSFCTSLQSILVLIMWVTQCQQQTSTLCCAFSFLSHLLIYIIY